MVMQQGWESFSFIAIYRLFESSFIVIVYPFFGRESDKYTPNDGIRSQQKKVKRGHFYDNLSVGIFNFSKFSASKFNYSLTNEF
jgi:hypothetical protein